MVAGGFLGGIRIVIARCFVAEGVVAGGVACVEAFDIGIRVDIGTRIVIARCSVARGVTTDGVTCVITFRKGTRTTIARCFVTDMRIGVSRVAGDRVFVNAVIVF